MAGNRHKGEVDSSWPRLKEFYRPTVLRITLTIFFIAISFMVLPALFSTIKVIPCTIQYFPGEEYQFSLCTINPVGMKLNTIYFGIELFDYIYQAIYLLFMILVIPYTLSQIWLIRT